MKKYLVIMKTIEEADKIVKDYLTSGKLASRIKYPEEVNNDEILDEMNKQLIRESDCIVIEIENKYAEYVNNCGKDVIIDGKLLPSKKNISVQEKDWEEFQQTGLVLYINQILHAFGYAITYQRERKSDGGRIIKVYPARVKFRGFGEESIDRAYTNLAIYMKDNGDNLYGDIIYNQMRKE